MTPPNAKRYRFGAIFDLTSSNYWVPRFDLRVSGSLYRKGIPIPPGPSFGGVDLNKVAGKSIAAIWDARSRELNVYGFYNT